jgi:hypothetical protein
MPLPKTHHPLFEVTLPSTKKTVYFRQMLVRDEKILLIAKAADDDVDINRAVKQVVNNCLMDTNIDTLTTFDVEYLFIKIRSVSIGSQVELAFKDSEDDKEYPFVVDLEKVEVKWPEEFPDGNGLIKISEDLAISMKYPPSSLFDEKSSGRAL